MNKIRVLAVVLMLGVLFAGTGGYAGEDGSTSPTRESIIELLELSNSYKLALQVMGQAMDAMKNGFNDSLTNDKKIPDEVWADIINETKNEMDKDSFYDMIVPIYRIYLTSSDIKAIVSFYKSEAGKNLIRVMPNIARDSGQAGQEWAKKAIQRIVPRIEKRLKEMGYSKEQVG